MNPILNPKIAFTLIKSFLIDTKRLEEMSPKELEQYKDKAFKRTIKKAYNTPLYHDKYKKAGIHPQDITGIKDLSKIPFISKDDIKNNFPDKITPLGYNTKKAHVVCTGGTTGKPVCVYTDFLSMAQAMMLSIREMRFLNINWKNGRTVHIGNFNPYRIDLVSQEHMQKHFKAFFKMDNILNIDVNTPILDLIKRLDEFKPDIIMTYPATFQHLAYLKRKGYGDNIKPKICWTGGAMLDNYTRNYVEEAFDTRLLNIYPSVESGANIAFECEKGIWHVHDDFFHLESINEDMNPVEPGKRGHLAVTRLFNAVTPIVRYVGMDDWVRLSERIECDCGICSTTIIDGVEGRMRANIVLPNGKVFPPGAFCFIEPVVSKYKTFKIKQYQIVQKKIDEIEILLVIDEGLRNVGPSVEKISEEIKEIYVSKVGPDVKIDIKEVKEIKHKKNSNKPAPIVISHVDQKNAYAELEKK